MKSALAAVALAAGLAAIPRPAPAAQHPSQITVTGVGEVFRAPDRAYVDLTIAETADQAVRATAAAQVDEQEVRRRLAAIGVTPGQIRTTGYGMSYNPRPPHPNPAVPVQYGFTVRRSLEITAPPDGTGPVVDAAVGGGAADLSVRFDLADHAAAYRAALAAAVGDAADQARTLADAAHVRLGPILQIAPATRPNVVQPLAQGRIMSVAVPTTIEPGTLTVTAQVSVTYAIAR